MRGALVAAYLWNAPEARAAAESSLGDELSARIDAIRSMVTAGLPEVRPDQLRHEAEFENGLLVVTFYGVLDEPPLNSDAFELTYEQLRGAVLQSADELTFQRTQSCAGEDASCEPPSSEQVATEVMTGSKIERVSPLGDDATALKHLASVRIGYRRGSWRGDLRVQFAAQPAVVTVTVIEVSG